MKQEDYEPAKPFFVPKNNLNNEKSNTSKNNFNELYIKGYDDCKAVIDNNKSLRSLYYYNDLGRTKKKSNKIKLF